MALLGGVLRYIIGNRCFHAEENLHGAPACDRTKSVCGRLVNLFPAKPNINPAVNPKLNDAIRKAVNDVVAANGGTAAKFAISIVDPANSYALGGFNDTTEHYIASEVKMAVLYAAYALFEMVTRFNALQSPKTPNALFHGLRTEMGDQIKTNSPLTAGVKDQFRLPHYEDMFKVTNLDGKLMIGFTHNYDHDLTAMIIPSDNHAAGRCIHGIGYGFLNGVLEAGGFFVPKDKKGVWVGGDYTGGYPYVRIPCDNDVDTAQGSTSRAMAWLMTVAIFDNILTSDSHVRMSNVLSRAAHEGDTSSFIRPEVANRLKDNQVTHSKIGYGPRKDNVNLWSEISLVRGINKDKTYTLAYQNIDYNPYTIDDVITIVTKALKVYEI
jgi:hypothetical protein